MTEDLRVHVVFAPPEPWTGRAVGGGTAPPGRGTIPQVTTSGDELLRDLARLRRDHARPLDVEAPARGARTSAGHLGRKRR